MPKAKKATAVAEKPELEDQFIKAKEEYDTAYERLKSKNFGDAGFEEIQKEFIDKQKIFLEIEANLIASKKESVAGKPEPTKPLDEFLNIELSKIDVSPLEPQKRRRERFTAGELAELAASILRHGVINPVTIRRADFGYELVAGERRFLASKRAGLKTIPAIVKELSDEDALEIQLLENLQRNDVHPFDEALWYRHLLDVTKTDLESLSLRVGKSVKYILTRIKLLDLSDAAQKAFIDGALPIAHALEISKYPPEAHEELLSFAYNNFGYESQSLYPLPKFIGQIQKHFLLQLKQAPFSTKSTELRPDGLACVKCPQRTGAAPLLFADNFSDKDHCLNRDCWNRKTTAHIQIQRRKIVETELKIVEPEKIEKAVAKIPLISDDYYLRDVPDGVTVLNSEKWKEINKDDYSCEFAESGVFYNGNRIGQKQKICRDPKCKLHLGRYSSNGSAVTDPEAESEKRRIRKEEIFDVKVGARVRFRVLKQAAEKFEGLIGCEPDYLKIIVGRLWSLQNSRDSCILEVFANYVAAIFKIEDTNYSLYEVNRAMEHRLDELCFDDLRKIAFLLMNGHLDPMFWFEKRGYQTDTYQSQKQIKQIAEDYEIGYRKLDAEERLALAPMKHKEVFRSYLQEIEAGNRDAALPRMHSGKWRPKD